MKFCDFVPELVIFVKLWVYCQKVSLILGQDCTSTDTVGLLEETDLTPAPPGGYVLKCYPVGCCGVLRTWRFHSTGSGGLIQLQVWKPIDALNNVFQLRGKTDYFSFGSSRKDVDSNLLVVRPGDVIGWRTPSGNIIGYKESDGFNQTHESIYQTDMPGLVMADNFTFSTASQSNVSYALQADLNSAPTPVFENLPFIITIAPNISMGEVVHGVSIIDESISFDESLYYELNSSTTFLSINSSGHVTVIDTPVAGDYEIRITVTHPCGSANTSTLFLNVLPESTPQTTRSSSLTSSSSTSGSVGTTSSGTTTTSPQTVPPTFTSSISFQSSLLTTGLSVNTSGPDTLSSAGTPPSALVSASILFVNVSSEPTPSTTFKGSSAISASMALSTTKGGSSATPPTIDNSDRSTPSAHVMTTSGATSSKAIRQTLLVTTTLAIIVASK